MKSTRKLAGPFMAVVPFVFILAFGARPEASLSRPHHFPTYSAEQEQNLEGFRNILIQSPPMNIAQQIPYEKVRELAKNWVNAVQKNKLTPLYPAFKSEIEEPGPRAEVIAYWEDLCCRENSLVLLDFRNHNLTQAKVDLKLLYQMLDSIKYSGGATVLAADSYEIHSIAFLSQEFKGSNKSLLTQIAPTVKSIVADGAGFKTCANIAQAEDVKFTKFEASVSKAEKEGKPLSEEQLDDSGDNTQLLLESTQITLAGREESLLRQMVNNFGTANEPVFVLNTWHYKPIAPAELNNERKAYWEAKFRSRGKYPNFAPTIH